MTIPKKQRQKKKKLGVAARQTKWAPFWTVVIKHGPGKKIHPSSLTHVRRNWRTRKLKIKPRIIRKKHLG